MLLIGGAALAAPITTKEGVLPPGTDLGEAVADQPTELFATELAGGKRSYLQNLGDMLFSSPAIFGGVARTGGDQLQHLPSARRGQCGAVHPRPVEPARHLRHHRRAVQSKADNGLFDPVTPPSLRGAKFLAPYGHDGRFASLRDFVRNVIVNEFAGPEPSGEVLDALVAYVQDIAFLPNPKLNSDGRLTDAASDAARRGERIFNRPFPHDAAMSCASCHQPSSAFVDHQVHDVGTGGFFKTKTLINANSMRRISTMAASTATTRWSAISTSISISA